MPRLADSFAASPEDRAMAWLLPQLRQWAPLAAHFGTDRIKRVSAIDPDYLLRAGGDVLMVGGVLVGNDVERVSGTSMETFSVWIGYAADQPGIALEDDAVTERSLFRELLRFLNAQGHRTLGGNATCLERVHQTGIGSHEQKNGSLRIISLLEVVYGLSLDLTTQEIL